MTKSHKNSFLAVALAGGMIGFGGCGAAAPDPVSTGGGNAAKTVAVVNKPANAAVENVSPGSVNPANAARPPVKTEKVAAADASGGKKIGVAECDEYIAKYEACINGKVPEAKRAALLAPLEMLRQGWVKAAANPPAKAALAGGCNIALATAKESLSAFSCDW